MIDKEVISVINNNKYLKTVFSLAERKKAVEKAYGIAGWVCFWIPIWVFGIEVFYYVTRLSVNNTAILMNIFGGMNVVEGRLEFVFDILLAVIPIVFALVGYLAFGVRLLTFNYLFLGIDAAFLIACVVAVIMGFQSTLYVFGGIYCVGSFLAAKECVGAYKDDKILRRHDGYPHFNGTLMKEEKVEKSLLRYKDEKTYDELYDERFEKYAKENPDSQMAQIYAEEKKQKDDAKLDEWFDSVMGKEDNDREI